MIIAGKCPPEPEELRAAADRGFDGIELYLERKHLDELEASIEAVENSEVEVESIHTPHVTLEEKEYFRKTDRLASILDAYIVFHSQYLHHVHIPELEELEMEADHGYENNPGASKRILESLILQPGHDLVLDTAHLFMATENYLQAIRELLDEHPEQIKLIHLCDSTRRKDGLPFGEGEMDMEKLCKVIDESEFDGELVLEVMPEDQEDALDKWNRYTD